MVMDPRELTALSRLLSYVLRHHPESVGITLDANGWVEVETLVAACQAHGKPLTRAVLERVVATSPKQRFAISADGRRVRASQGHSIDVDLAYPPVAPPDTLFHGTVAAHLPEILSRGLEKMKRHHVHLSADAETARVVAARRGAPIILRIAAARMHRAGHVFHVSANGVWLTEHVPPEFIERVAP